MDKIKILKHLTGIIILLFCLQTGFGSFSLLAQQQGKVIVQLDNLKNNTGEIILSLFNSEDGFPMETEKACRNLTIEPNNNKQAVFHKLPFGEYAISVHHDEDSDKEMDTNFFGIPSEGIGVSNNAKGSFGPPDFEDAKFTLNQKRRKISIKLVYL